MRKLILSASLMVLVSLIYGSKPEISFFCELPEDEFVKLFADSSLIKELKDMKITLRIGLHDFGKKRTETILKLNQAGISVVAWLLLPEEDGYWFNMYNGEKAIKRYEDFKVWSTENQLKWEGLGIDLEPDMNDAKLVIKHPLRFAWKAYLRLWNDRSLKYAAETYRRLFSKMSADGYLVESYIIPYLFEERNLGTSSFQKLLGICDIKTEKEIPMLYTSGLGNPAIITLFHSARMPVAIGSTGGGVNIEGFELASLTWDQLERDLLIASKLTQDITIFCLESSVQKGFLEKIKELDFNRESPDISQYILKQQKTNKFVRRLLETLDHPFWFTIAIAIILTDIFFAIFIFCKYVIRLLTERASE